MGKCLSLFSVVASKDFSSQLDGRYCCSMVVAFASKSSRNAEVAITTSGHVAIEDPSRSLHGGEDPS